MKARLFRDKIYIVLSEKEWAGYMRKRKNRDRGRWAALFRSCRLRLALLAVVAVSEGAVAVTVGAGGFPDEGIRAGAGNEVEQTVAELKIPRGKIQENSRPEENGTEIRIAMVGDVILHEAVYESCYENGSYDFSGLFANISGELQQMDIAVANQETILGGQELGISGYPEFNSPYEEADALAEAGFNVILSATNHALDAGAEGVDNTLEYWKDKYPETGVLGIQKSGASGRDIYVYEKDGFRVAILNYTYGTNINESLLEEPGTQFLVNTLEEETVREDVRKAKELADFVIVCPHWGTENSVEISEEQKDWTEIFLSSGVDLVIGTHPHVIQKMETVTDGLGNEMLVYYSLGNCVSNQKAAMNAVGAMAEVTIRKDDSGVHVDEASVKPLVTHKAPDGSFTAYFLDEYTEKLAEENTIRTTDESFSLAYCRQLWNRVFEEPDGETAPTEKNGVLFADQT